MNTNLFTRSVGYMGALLFTLLNMSASAQSYCIPACLYPTYTVTDGVYIVGLHITGAGGTSLHDVSLPEPNCYRDSTEMSVAFAPGGVYPTTLNGNNYGGKTTQTWIDFDDNGTFESSERVGGSGGYGMTATYNMVIPSGAMPGNHRMRVTVGYTTDIPAHNYPDMQPCETRVEAETRDYTANICSSPEAGMISASSGDVCIGAPIAFSSSADGGTWSSQNTAVATVSASGEVWGVAGGTTIISYAVSNACGTAYATQEVTVASAPEAGTISGPSFICPASAATLSSTIAGGVWSTDGSVSVDASAGIIHSHPYPGMDSATITYTVANSCGATSSANYRIGLSYSPYAGSIYGPSSVCQMGSATFMATEEGGTWSASNGYFDYGNTFFPPYWYDPSMPITVTYGVTNECGTATAETSITVMHAPYAGEITGGSDMLCTGSSMHLDVFYSDFGMSYWTSSNESVATVSETWSGADVMGMSEGMATISYIIENVCGVSSSTRTVNVVPVLNAGTITGPDAFCQGTAATFTTDGNSGGYWDEMHGVVSISDGSAYGMYWGNTTVRYTVANECGTSTATRDVYVYPIPDAGYISGESTVSVGGSTYLYSTVPGGEWSSADPSIAVVESGNVTGVSAGTTDITFTISNECGTAYTTQSITVSDCTTPVVDAITGDGSVCAGNTINLSSSTPGGSWSSSNTSVANISGDGVVSGVAAGTATITYSVYSECGSAYATADVTVNTPPAAVIAGPDVACAGAAVTFTAPAGNCHTVAASFNASSYSSAATYPDVVDNMTMEAWFNWDGNTTQLQTIMANGNTTSSGYSMWLDGTTGALSGAIGSIGWIYQPTPVPVAANTWHHAAMVRAEGAWTLYIDGEALSTAVSAPGATPIAPSGSFSIGSGTFSDIQYGFHGLINEAKFWNVARTAAQISADMTECDAAAQPGLAGYWKLTEGSGIAGSDINGNNLVMSNSAWSDVSGVVYNWDIASVPAITGSIATTTFGAAGAYAVTLTATKDGCNATAAKTVTITSPAEAGTVSGPATLCIGTPLTFSASGAAGGTWSVSNSTVATVNSAGVVTGLSTGSVVISYTVTSACGISSASMPVTVNGAPPVISGLSSVCVGATTVLTNSVDGGAWSASNAKATVDESGTVTGVTAGSVTITYTNGCGYRTFPMTVNATPASITGASAVCEGATVSVASITTGGSWTISGEGFATIDPATRIVTGVDAGIATVSYTLANGCYKTRQVTVNVMPSALASVPALCVGQSISLGNDIAGGMWSSTMSSRATVSAEGVVSAMSAGNATIKYTLGSCVASAPVTVNITPASISGLSSLCQGSAVSLTNSVAGGVWSSSDAVATVAGGVVSGVANGSATITYAVGSCYKTKDVTVYTTPSSLAVIAPMCVGDEISLTNDVMGGTWSTASTSRATITEEGMLVARSAGTSIVRYTVGSCSVAAPFTVNTTPSAIGGSLSSICMGTALTLTNTVAGGAWSSSADGVATVASGVVTGVANGTAVITYAIGGCYKTKPVTVHLVPEPLAAVAPLCVGDVVPMTNDVPGGVWSVTNTKVTITEDGVATARNSGLVSVRYTVGSCAVSTQLTVNTTPAAIVGSVSSICAGSVLTFTNSVAGGTWTSSNESIAPVSAGLVTGVASGTAVITYAVGSCYKTKPVTINVVPEPLAAVSPLCVGDVVPMSNSVPGGVWSVTNTKATITEDGVATTRNSGLVSVRYIVGACAVSTQLTINTTPAAITGGSSMCNGSVITLGNTVAGGTWSSSNTGIASIMGSGLSTGVRGMSAGAATITYSIGSCYRTKAITVNSCGAKEEGAGTDIATSVPDIRIFPNPSTGVVNIASSVPVIAHVYAADGKLVMQQQDATQLDMSAMASGMYMIVLYDTNHQKLKAERLMKE